MPTKKKNNYIVYELKKLENYINQLQVYLDSIDLDDLQDRLDVRYSQNGNPIVKVIASREAQVKSFRENLEKLPPLYETVNRLRKLADDGTEGETVDKARGDKDLPGLFKHKMLGDGNNKSKENSEEDIEEEPDTIEEEDTWDEDE